MIEQFTDWFDSRKETIDHVGILLASTLSPEPAELIEDLKVIESWGDRMGEILAEANSWLDSATLYYLPAKSHDINDIDRKAIAESQCADIRKVRDIVEQRLRAIERRLILGASILRFEKPHAMPEVKFPAYKSPSQILRGE